MTATVLAQGLNAAQSKYHYDSLYQLVKAQYPAAVFGGEVHEWTYDALGNRMSSKVNGTGPSYSYLKNGGNTLNGQRLSSDGVNAYTYDPNGSQLTRTGPGGNYTFGYDADNRLASISGAETATYTYDYQGRRISKTEGGATTTYLYNGLNPIAETVGRTPKYVLNGPSIDEPLALSASGTISYLNADGLGSVVATNNAAGTVGHSLSFDAWGVPRNETGTRAHGSTYTGREAGVAGMHFYRARYYQPGSGRLVAEEPFGHLVDSSFYAYAGRFPTQWVDPLGAEFGDYWDIRATLTFYDDVANTSTDPLAAAGASVAAALLRTTGMAEAQQAGERLGIGDTLCGVVKGALSVLKGLSIAAPLPFRSAGNAMAGPKLLNESRTFSTVSARFWKTLGGAKHLGIKWIFITGLRRRGLEEATRPGD